MLLSGQSRFMCTAIPIPEIPAPTMIISSTSSRGVVAMFIRILQNN